MWLTQDKTITDRAYFARCINERFRPPTPTRRNPLGELASLQKTSTVDDYTERFLAHVARHGTLDEQQQVNIYTVSLLEPLKTDVELQKPQDMEMAMSLAQAYERRAAVVADSNKSTSMIRPTARTLPPKVPNYNSHNTGTTSYISTSCPTRPFKRLTTEEMTERRHMGLCFNCDEP